MQKRPDELAADVFEAKFEMSVLVDGVVAAIEGSGADIQALLVGDFVVVDEMRGIAGARSRDCGIERMKEGIAESDAGRARFDQAGFRCAIEHAGLRSHVGN